MASSGAVKGGQDMVVSIRYRNDLPPPPMPPKLLNIDHGGLSQYLTTGFAAAMARREEPNIEADAEGGMPIDMIGIPGYFLGDESAIMAPEIQPILDPADQALMLTPEQLRNQDSKSTNVSFLRRTQYMTSQNARANDPLVRQNPRAVKSAVNPATQPEVLARDDKENIRRHLQKGFDLAYPDSVPYNGPSVQSQAPTATEKEAWRNPVHPDNPGLKPTSFFPILPDLDMADDSGGLMYVKFDKPPLPALQGRRDDRIDVAMLQSIAITSQQAAHQAKRAAFLKNPELYEDPGPHGPCSWSVTVPPAHGKVGEIRKVLNNADPGRDDPQLRQGLYKPGINSDDPDDTMPRLDYERIRTYMTVDQRTTSDLYGLSLYDPENPRAASGQVTSRKQAAAYYFPVPNRWTLKSDRAKVGAGAKNSQMDEEDQKPFDLLSVITREPTAIETKGRTTTRGAADSTFQEEWIEIKAAAEKQEAEVEAEEARREQEAQEQDVTMEEVDVATNGMPREDGEEAYGDMGD
jgi:RNA polymerase II-associated factor 1